MAICITRVYTRTADQGETALVGIGMHIVVVLRRNSRPRHRARRG